jgi:hypothetical protein
LRRSRILGETQVFPRILKKRTGYADMESKERFPHPHSLDDYDLEPVEIRIPRARSVIRGAIEWLEYNSAFAIGGTMQHTRRVTFLALVVFIIPSLAQTISSADAPKHIGEQATVCGMITGEHIAANTQGTPTFIDLDKPYPNQLLTVVVWANDKANVGILPTSGQLCVTGRIDQYRGTSQIVLRSSANWYVPK